MAYNAKNYRKQGAYEWVIGDTLDVLEGAKITAEGEQADNIAKHPDASAASNEDIATKQNAIIDALVDIGVLAAE